MAKFWDDPEFESWVASELRDGVIKGKLPSRSISRYEPPPPTEANATSAANRLGEAANFSPAMFSPFAPAPDPTKLHPADRAMLGQAARAMEQREAEKREPSFGLAPMSEADPDLLRELRPKPLTEEELSFQDYLKARGTMDDERGRNRLVPYDFGLSELWDLQERLWTDYAVAARLGRKGEIPPTVVAGRMLESTADFWRDMFVPPEQETERIWIDKEDPETGRVTVVPADIRERAPIWKGISALWLLPKGWFGRASQTLPGIELFSHGVHALVDTAILGSDILPISYLRSSIMGKLDGQNGRFVDLPEKTYLEKVSDRLRFITPWSLITKPRDQAGFWHIKNTPHAWWLEMVRGDWQNMLDAWGAGIDFAQEHFERNPLIPTAARKLNSIYFPLTGRTRDPYVFPPDLRKPFDEMSEDERARTLDIVLNTGHVMSSPNYRYWFDTLREENPNMPLDEVRKTAADMAWTEPWQQPYPREVVEGFGQMMTGAYYLYLTRGIPYDPGNQPVLAAGAVQTITPQDTQEALQAFVQGGQKIGKVVSVVDPDYSYTWPFDREAEEEYLEHRNLVQEQLGRDLGYWESYRLKEHYENPAIEMVGEAMFDLGNIKPFVYLWEGAFRLGWNAIKGTAKGGVRLAMKIPIIGNTVKWLAQETTRSLARNTGFRAAELFGTFFQSAKDRTSFIALIDDFVEKGRWPITVGQRQMRIARALQQLVEPEEWPKIADRAAERAVKAARELATARGITDPDVLKNIPAEPRLIVQEMADAFEARFLDRAQAAAGRTVYPALVDAFRSFFGKTRKFWIEQVLSARPGFTVINYIDSGFRMLLYGGRAFDDLPSILARTDIPREIYMRFPVTEAGAALPLGEAPRFGPLTYLMEYQGSSVLQDMPWPLGGRPWKRTQEGIEAFAERFPALHEMMQQLNWGNWGAAWKQYNAWFEFAMSAKLYDSLYWRTFVPMDRDIGERLILTLLGDASEEAQRIARVVWQQARDNPAMMQELLAEATFGKGAGRGRPVWSFIVPHEIHAWLQGMPPEMQQTFINRGVIKLRPILQADELTDEVLESVRSSLDELVDEFVAEMSIHNQVNQADDVIRQRGRVADDAARRANASDADDVIDDLAAISGEAPEREVNPAVEVFDEKGLLPRGFTGPLAIASHIDRDLSEPRRATIKQVQDWIRDGYIVKHADGDWGLADDFADELLERQGRSVPLDEEQVAAEAGEVTEAQQEAAEAIGEEAAAREEEVLLDRLRGVTEVEEPPQVGPVTAEVGVSLADDLLEEPADLLTIGDRPTIQSQKQVILSKAPGGITRPDYPTNAQGATILGRHAGDPNYLLIEFPGTRDLSMQDPMRRANQYWVHVDDLASMDRGRLRELYGAPRVPERIEGRPDALPRAVKDEIYDQIEADWAAIADAKGPEAVAAREAGLRSKEAMARAGDAVNRAMVDPDTPSHLAWYWDDLSLLRDRLQYFLRHQILGAEAVSEYFKSTSEKWAMYWTAQAQIYDASAQYADEIYDAIQTGEARFLKRLSVADFMERVGFRMDLDDQGRLIAIHDENSIFRAYPIDSPADLRNFEAIMYKGIDDPVPWDAPFPGRRPPQRPPGPQPPYPPVEPAPGGAPPAAPAAPAGEAAVPPGEAPPAAARITPLDGGSAELGWELGDVPIDDIKTIPDFQPRNTSGEPLQVDQERVRNIADNWNMKQYEPIKVNIVQPGNAYEYGEGIQDGDVVLMGGHHRMAAGRLAGETSLPAQVYNETFEEAERIAQIDNMIRQEQTPYEKGRALKGQMDRGHSEGDLARIVFNDPKKATYVARLVSLTELAPDVADMVGRYNWFTEKHGFALADAVIEHGINPEFQQQVVTMYMAEYGPTVTMLENFLSTFGPQIKRAVQMDLGFTMDESFIDDFVRLTDEIKAMKGRQQTIARVLNDPVLKETVGEDVVQELEDLKTGIAAKQAEIERMAGLDPQAPRSMQQVQRAAEEVAEEAPLDTDSLPVGTRVRNLMGEEGVIVEQLDNAPNGQPRYRFELDDGSTKTIQGVSIEVVEETPSELGKIEPETLQAEKSRVQELVDSGMSREDAIKQVADEAEAAPVSQTERPEGFQDRWIVSAEGHPKDQQIGYSEGYVRSQDITDPADAARLEGLDDIVQIRFDDGSVHFFTAHELRPDIPREIPLREAGFPNGFVLSKQAQQDLLGRFRAWVAENSPDDLGVLDDVLEDLRQANQKGYAEFLDQMIKEPDKSFSGAVTGFTYAGFSRDETMRLLNGFIKAQDDALFERRGMGLIDDIAQAFGREQGILNIQDVPHSDLAKLKEVQARIVADQPIELLDVPPDVRQKWARVELTKRDIDRAIEADFSQSHINDLQKQSKSDGMRFHQAAKDAGLEPSEVRDVLRNEDPVAVLNQAVEEVEDEAIKQSKKAERIADQASQKRVEPSAGDLRAGDDAAPSVDEAARVGEDRPDADLRREADRPAPGGSRSTHVGGGLAEGEKKPSGVITVSEEFLPQPGAYVDEHYLDEVFERTKAHFRRLGSSEDEAAEQAFSFFEHQVDNANRALSSFDEGRAFVIADDTGTGKTYSGALIADLLHTRGADRMMLVAPNNLIISQWQDVLEPLGFEVVVIKTKDAMPAVMPAGSKRVYATTYHSMTSWHSNKSLLEFIGNDTLDFVLFDESHYLKNWYTGDTNRAIAGVDLAGLADHTLFMSATPIESPLHAGYMLGSTGVFDSFDDMLEHLDIQRVTRERTGYRGGQKYTYLVETFEGVTPKKLATLNDEMVRQGRYIRHEMSYRGMFNKETGEQLFAYSASVPVRIDAETAQKYARFMQITDKFQQGRHASTIGAQRVGIGRALLENGKMPVALDLAEKKLAQGESVAIFVWRKEGSRFGEHLADFAAGKKKYSKGSPMPAYYKALIEAGVEIRSPIEMVRERFPDAVEISGDVTGRARLAAMEKFNSGEAKVVVATIDAGGTGLSLHDTIGLHPRVQINLTVPYTALGVNQTAGRTFRMGSQSHGQIYWLYTPTPLEEKYTKRTMKFMERMGALISGEEGIEVISDDEMTEFLFAIDDETSESLQQLDELDDILAVEAETSPIDDRRVTPPWQREGWEPVYAEGAAPDAELPVIDVPPQQPVVRNIGAESWEEAEQIIYSSGDEGAIRTFDDLREQMDVLANQEEQSRLAGNKKEAANFRANQDRLAEDVQDLVVRTQAEQRFLEEFGIDSINEAPISEKRFENLPRSTSQKDIDTLRGYNGRYLQLFDEYQELTDIDLRMDALDQMRQIRDAADEVYESVYREGWGRVQRNQEKAARRATDMWNKKLRDEGSRMYLDEPYLRTVAIKHRDAPGASLSFVFASTEGPQGISELSGIFVPEDLRGQGYAEEMFLKFLDMAESGGRRRFYVNHWDEAVDGTYPGLEFMKAMERKGYIRRIDDAPWSIHTTEFEIVADRAAAVAQEPPPSVFDVPPEARAEGDIQPTIVATEAGPQFSMFGEVIDAEGEFLVDEVHKQAFRQEAVAREWVERFGNDAADHRSFIQMLERDRRAIQAGIDRGAVPEGAADEVQKLINEVNGVAQQIKYNIGTQDTLFSVGFIPYWMRPQSKRILDEAAIDSVSAIHAAREAADNWYEWLAQGGGRDLFKAIPEEDQAKIVAWGEQAIKAKRELRDVARHGTAEIGDLSFVTDTVDGALPKTLEVMIDYATDYNIDAVMKNFYPFWKFPTRSLPFWADTIATHPEILTFWMKYQHMSERYIYQKGAVDSEGRALNRFRGYIPVPGTYLWWNPLAPISAKVVLPSEHTIYSDPREDMADRSPLNQTINILYEWGRQFGFNLAPWWEFIIRQNDLVDRDQFPMRTIIPIIDMVPPWVQHDILLQARKLHWFPQSIEYLSPQVSWKDYLVERELYGMQLQAIYDAPEDERAEIALATEQAILEREGNPIWDRAQRAVEESEYYKRVFGYFTGIYAKEFTDGEADLRRLRHEINFLRDMINNEVGAEIFGLPEDRETRERMWQDRRYAVDDGVIYGLYSVSSWTRTPTEGNLSGERRRQYMEEEVVRQIQRRDYFAYNDLIYSDMDNQRKKLPVGAPWELEKRIYDQYGKDKSYAETTNRFALARRTVAHPGPGRSAPDWADWFVDTWYGMIYSTKPTWDREGETYGEYLERVALWEQKIPQIAEAMLPHFQRDLTTLPPDAVWPDLLSVSSIEDMNQWDLENDDVVDALNRVWEDNYWSPFWDMVGDLDGYERDLAEMQFKMIWPMAPSEKTLIEWVEQLYGNKFSRQELREVIQSGVMDIEGRLAVDKDEMDKQADQVWLWMAWVGPNKSKLEKAFFAVGGDPRDWEKWWSSDGDPSAWRNKDEFNKFYGQIAAAANRLNLQQPTEAQLQEWVAVQGLHEEYKAEAQIRFGENIFVLSAQYNELPRSEREDFREQHPQLVEFWDFRDQFAIDHPLWGEYYNPDATQASAGGTGRGSSGRRSFKTGGRRVSSATGRAIQDIPTLAYRSSYDVEDLLEGEIGRGRATRLVKWPTTLARDVPEELKDEVDEAARTGESITPAANDYLEKLKAKHSSDREFIESLQARYFSPEGTYWTNRYGGTLISS